MRDDGKVVLEVKEVLDYLGINYDKWRKFSDAYEARIQSQAEDPEEILDDDESA